MTPDPLSIYDHAAMNLYARPTAEIIPFRPKEKKRDQAVQHR